MALPPGNYQIFSELHPYRLSWYQGKYVRVNDDSNVFVEIRPIWGGYQMRFNNKGTMSPWFGADDDLTENSKVILKDDPHFAWSITPAGQDVFKIGVFNQNAVWCVSYHPTNSEPVSLRPSEGLPTELWRFERV